MTIQDSQHWRLLNTGIRPAADNFAMNRAILEAHQAGQSPHTLRFLGFHPAALIGFHQDVEQELNVDYCHKHNIEIQRRLTGGGAIYFDEQQFGWELYLNRQMLGTTDMSAIATRICETIARALQTLGVNAKFRPRNDIEVDGRKISGTGGFFDGDSFLYQGTVLVDFDVERMMRTLRIPAAKISDKSIKDARDRIVTLKELMAEDLPHMDVIQQCLADAIAKEFNVQWQMESQLNGAEQTLFEKALKQIDSHDWVYQHQRPVSDAPLAESLYKAKGGLMRTAVRYDLPKKQIKQVWITGDFFVKPQRLIVDLEAALKDVSVSRLNDTLEQFFARNNGELLMLSLDDFRDAILSAIRSVDESV
jgi:lipoate-protein ligase A